MTGDRTEALADAVLVIGASRLAPNVAANQWADLFGVTSDDLDRALARRKGRARGKVCRQPLCTNRHHAKGLCYNHYLRHWRATSESPWANRRRAS